MSYVQCTHTHATYGHYAHDLIGNMCAFIVQFLLLIVNMYILNTSGRALKPSQDKENRLLRTREREREPMCGRNSRAKAGKINEAERDRARHSTLTADA